MRELDASVGNSAYEQEPANMKCGISIKGLLKKFKVDPVVLIYMLLNVLNTRLLVVLKLLWTICI